MSNINRTKILLDTVTFAAFLIAMDPGSIGIAIHEWLALALGATVIVHLLLIFLSTFQERQVYHHP